MEKLERLSNVYVKNGVADKVFCRCCKRQVGVMCNDGGTVELTNVRLMKHHPHSFDVHCRKDSSSRKHGHIYRAQCRMVHFSSKQRVTRTVRYFDGQRFCKPVPCMGIPGSVALFDRDADDQHLSAVTLVVKNTSRHPVNFLIKVTIACYLARFSIFRVCECFLFVFCLCIARDGRGAFTFAGYECSSLYD